MQSFNYSATSERLNPNVKTVNQLVSTNRWVAARRNSGNYSPVKGKITL